MRLALATGMRKNALLGLRWQDIDFEYGFITLCVEFAKKGKTKRVPLSAAARLAAHLCKLAGVIRRS